MRESLGVTLDEIMDEFDASASVEESGPKMYTTLTVWVPIETKARYKAIQKKRRKKKFSSTLRELIEAAIARAEKNLT